MRIAPRKKRVRLHFADARPSLEGYLIGRANGSFHLAEAEVIEDENRTVALDSASVVVARDHVWFYEVLR